MSSQLPTTKPPSPTLHPIPEAQAKDISSHSDPLNPTDPSFSNPSTGNRTLDLLDSPSTPTTTATGLLIDPSSVYQSYPPISTIAAISPRPSTFRSASLPDSPTLGASYSSEKEVVMTPPPPSTATTITTRAPPTPTPFFNGGSSSPNLSFRTFSSTTGMKSPRESIVSALGNGGMGSPFLSNGRFGEEDEEEGEGGRMLTQQQQRSFFDAESSDDDGDEEGEGIGEEEIVLAAAAQSWMNRPMAVPTLLEVKRGSVAQALKLEEYFADGRRSGAITYPSGSGLEKAGRVLGEDLSLSKKLDPAIGIDGDSKYPNKSAGLSGTENRDIFPATATTATAKNPDPLKTNATANTEDTLSALERRHQHRKMSLLDALRSNPPDLDLQSLNSHSHSYSYSQLNSSVGVGVGFPRRAASTPMMPTRMQKRTQKRKSVTLPDPVDVGNGSGGGKERGYGLRQSVVSTPYPTPVGHGEGESEKGEKRFLGKGLGLGLGKEEGEREGGLVVVLYRPGTAIPKIGRIILPGSSKKKERKFSAESFPMRNRNHTEQQQQHMRVQAGFADDEQLFRMLRAEYERMRGRGLVGRVVGSASARGLRGVALLGYRGLGQLATRVAREEGDGGRERRVVRKAWKGWEGEVAVAEKEERMLEGIRRPRVGKGKREWAEWVERGNSSGGEVDEEEEKIAVEFVEGWRVGRIVGVLGIVVVASLAAVLLWVFLGVGGQGQGQEEVLVRGAGVKEVAFGYRGAGGRVGAGAVLGILVLLVGWSGVGAWVLLSWLVV